MKATITKVGSLFQIEIKDERGNTHSYVMKDADITKQEIVGDIGIIEIEGKACLPKE